MRWIGEKKDKSLKGRLKRLVQRVSFGAVSIIAAAPLFLSPLAHAAPNTTYTPHDFTDLGLVTDRTTPSGGFTVTPDLLTLNVDTTQASTSGHFYLTEGLQAPLTDTDSIRAKLFVDKDWQNKPVETGLWAIAGSTNDTDQIGWPILQFATTTDGSPGFRTWNTFTGDWSGTSAFDATKGWDKWYGLEISITPQGVEFYVNNTKVDSYSSTDGSDNLNIIKGVIFNSFNTASDNTSDNYSVKWQNFATGSVTTGDKEACKNGGYTTMTDEHNQAFKNQGQCVSYMNGRPDNGTKPPVTVQTLKF
jgi:hypothetical protein